MVTAEVLVVVGLAVDAVVVVEGCDVVVVEVGLWVVGVVVVVVLLVGTVAPPVKSYNYTVCTYKTL